MIQRLNYVRRENPALQRLDNVGFLDAANDAIIAYAKREGPNAIICVVNLDPHHAQEGLVQVPYDLGVAARLRRRGPARRRDLPLARGGQLRAPGPRRARRPRPAGEHDMTPPPPPTSSGHWFEADPVWFKKAVFYEIHLRGFFDGNSDGSGDFRGLTEKLDYLQWLGIDVVWLLPMFASPLRDGGYDIADYYEVHPDYGTIDDVRAFIEAAHERGLRVIADLVMNHTSTEHEWFQARPRGAGRLARARLVRVVRHAAQVRGRADHLHRHRDVELDVGRRRRGLLLAPLLLPPARPQLRQPRGPRGDARRPALLAGPRPRRLPPRRRALPLRARRAPTARTCPRRTSSSSRCAPPSTRSTPTASCWPRPTSGPRTSSSTSARATSATWPSTSP